MLQGLRLSTNSATILVDRASFRGPDKSRRQSLSLPRKQIISVPQRQGDLNDYIACLEEKSCQTTSVPFCVHPQGMKHSECEVQETDLVFKLTKEGNIECNSDSDCPPVSPPNWEWNEETMIYYGVSSITEMSVYGPACSWLGVDEGESFVTKRLCEANSPAKAEPFCSHEFGRNHPECQRCNLVTPLPKPRCLDYDLQRRNMDQCCDLLFNDTVAGFNPVRLRFFLSRRDYKDDLRQEITQNFTKTECQLSQLHQPAGSLPISPFDPDFCCSFGFCRSYNAEGVPLSFNSATVGVRSLSPRSVLDQNSELNSCPLGFCKRPSLARPGNLICCQVVRASWRRRRIAICPNSCD